MRERFLVRIEKKDKVVNDTVDPLWMDDPFSSSATPNIIVNHIPKNFKGKELSDALHTLADHLEAEPYIHDIEIKGFTAPSETDMAREFRLVCDYDTSEKEYERE